MKNIAGNAAFTLLCQVIGIAASVLMGIAIARSLGPSGRGTFTYATVGLGLLLTYAEGVSSGVIAQYKTDGLPSALVYRAMFRTLAGPAFLLASMVAACALLVSGQRVLLAVAVALPFALYGSAAKGFLIADERLREANAVSVINSVGLAVIVLPLLFFAHVGISIVLASWIGCYLMAALLTAFWTRRYALGNVAREEIGATAREQFYFSLKSCSVFFVSYLNLRIDLFIVGALRGAVELGWYALAVAAGELLWQWSKALHWSAFGRLAGEKPEAALELMAKLTRTIFLLQSLAALAVYWLAPWLIPSVYGAAFTASVPVFRMLLPGIVAYSLEAGFGFFIMVRLKRPLVNLVIQTSSTVACALLTVLLLPRYGLVGAAFATSFTYCAVTLVSIVIFLQATHLHPLRLLFPSRSLVEGGKSLLSPSLEEDIVA